MEKSVEDRGNDLLEVTFCRSRDNHSNAENLVFNGHRNDYSGNSNEGSNHGIFNWFKIDTARNLSPFRGQNYIRCASIATLSKLPVFGEKD